MALLCHPGIDHNVSVNSLIAKDKYLSCAYICFGTCCFCIKLNKTMKIKACMLNYLQEVSYV